MMVVLPSASVSVSVLIVSGHSGPHRSVLTSRSGGITSRYVPPISISPPSELRHPKCQAPPGRRSISQRGIVHPSGPSIQCGRCSGLVQHSHTSSRGASTTRVMTIWLSVGVVNVVIPVLFAMTISAPPLLELFQVGIEALIVLLPVPAIGAGPFGDLLERPRFELTRSPLRLAAAHDEPGTLEHPQVLRDRRPAHVERLRELGDGGRAVREPLEDKYVPRQETCSRELHEPRERRGGARFHATGRDMFATRRADCPALECATRCALHGRRGHTRSSHWSR